eukprot:1974631-Prymnesium_polylepis.1
MYRGSAAAPTPHPRVGLGVVAATQPGGPASRIPVVEPEAAALVLVEWATELLDAAIHEETQAPFSTTREPGGALREQRARRGQNWRSRRQRRFPNAPNWIRSCDWRRWRRHDAMR